MDQIELEERANRGDNAARVLLAARLDQSGSHSAAIDWLARAARDEHPDALWLLGCRLLTGQNAPSLPAQAIGLLKDAAKSGSNDAAALNAVLAGAGIYRPGNWEEACEWLTMAGNRGDISARQQLDLISGNRHDETTPAQACAEYWLKPAEGRQLRDAPRMMVFERLIEPEVCVWLMACAEKRLEPAQVYHSASGRVLQSDMRTNQVARFGLLETNLLNVAIQARIAAAVGIPPDFLEAFSVLHYTVGQEAREHADYIDPAAAGAKEQIARFGQRVATVLVYLNDDYTGGETEFPHIGIKHRGKTGDALAFFGADGSGVPDPRSIHAGRAPNSGEKWVLSQFIRNKRMTPS